MNKNTKVGIIIGSISLVLGLAGLFWYLGMSNNNKLIAKIPKDAAVVFKADLKSLSDKAEFKKWKDLEMFNNFKGDDKILEDIIDEPKKCGVNFLQNAYGFMSKGDDYFGGIVFGIKDAKDFEETIKRIDSDIEVQKTDGVYSAEVDKGDVALVWDKNVALLYFRNEDDVMERAKQAFNQDEDMSMLDNDTYMEFESLDADLGTYLSMKQIQQMAQDMSGTESNQIASMEKVEGVGMTVLFDDQQMLIDATYYPIEGATQEEISMMNEEGISDDLMKLISPTQPKGFYAANMNLDKVLGMYAQLNEAMIKEGFSIDELKNGLNGEMTFSLIDVKNKQTIREVADYDSWEPTGFDTPVPMKLDTTNELTPIYKLNFGIKDRGVIENLIAKFVAKINEPEPSIEGFDFNKDVYEESFNSYITPLDLAPTAVEPNAKRYQYNGLEVLELREESLKWFFKYEGNYLSISNDESSFTSQSFSWDDDMEEMLKDKAGSGYLDLDYKNYSDIERENARMVKDSKSFLEMLDNMKFSSDGMTVHFEMNFTDSPDHILWRMIQAIDTQVSSNRRGYN